MALVDRARDTAALRRACSQLQTAVAAVRRHHGDGVDVRRLSADADRVAEDVELLCGPEAPAAAPPPPVREVIPDGAYAHDFWMDAEDEGLGSYGTRGR